jgi:hypothetical protein
MIDLTDSKTKQELLDAVKEISVELGKMDDCREQVKNIIDAASDAFDIPKPLIRKVAKLYHKKTAAQFENETAEIKNVYKQITLV